ncbi:DUF4328 domain-containing protein, partial [Chloroflexota bacterium]
GQMQAKWVYFVFGALAILSVVIIWFTIIDAGYIQDFLDGRFVSEDKLLASDDRLVATHWIHFGLMIIGAIVCLAWIHRAYRNLPFLHAQGLSFSPGWAVGWFFIPVAGLVQPYRVLSEIWKASDPDMNGKDGISWKEAQLPKIVVCWWALFLASWVARFVASSLADPGDSSDAVTFLEFREYLDSLLVHRYAFLASHIIYILGFLTTIYLVRTINKRQENKHELIPASNIDHEHDYDRLPGIARGSDFVCPLCNNPVDKDWTFCPYCKGHLIEVIGYTCSKCGSDVHEDWETCPHCGEPLKDSR